MSAREEVSIEPFSESHLEGVVELCRELSWESYLEPETARRVLSAPGAVTFVAVVGGSVVGLAHLLTDGLIQSHLSLVGVLPGHRRAGIARALVREAFRSGGAKWLDLSADPGSEDFYRSFVHQQTVGFRVYPSEPDA